MASPVDVTNNNAIAMEYMAFMPKNLVGTDNQRIDCVIEVCIDDCPTKNDIKCPTGGNHYVYQYEVKGFN